MINQKQHKQLLHSIINKLGVNPTLSILVDVLQEVGEKMFDAGQENYAQEAFEAAELLMSVRDIVKIDEKINNMLN